MKKRKNLWFSMKKEKKNFQNKLLVFYYFLAFFKPLKTVALSFQCTIFRSQAPLLSNSNIKKKDILSFLSVCIFIVIYVYKYLPSPPSALTHIYIPHTYVNL